VMNSSARGFGRACVRWVIVRDLELRQSATVAMRTTR
jgi:hypothetical protein